MAKLILTSPEGQQTVTLAARNSLGRHPDSSIQILDKIVSKEHCRIEDLDSLNGTFLNGARLSGKRPLLHGDEFSLGATRARFELEARERNGVPDTVQRSALARGRRRHANHSAFRIHSMRSKSRSPPAG